MAFDLDMIKGVYAHMQEGVKAARRIGGRPLTLTVEILYSQWQERTPALVYERVKSSTDFAPVHVMRREFI